MIDVAIGVLVGFLIGSVSGVFCFALVCGMGRDDLDDETDDWDDEEDE